MSFSKIKNNLPEGVSVLPMDVKLSVENVNGVRLCKDHHQDAKASKML